MIDLFFFSWRSAWKKLTEREWKSCCRSLSCAHSLTLFLPVSLALRKTLQLARLFKDKAVEAQACYSLGNTYTLLQDYERAIDFHLKHLVIAQDLNDRYDISTSLLLTFLWLSLIVIKLFFKTGSIFCGGAMNTCKTKVETVMWNGLLKTLIGCRYHNVHKCTLCILKIY